MKYPKEILCPECGEKRMVDWRNVWKIKKGKISSKCFECSRYKKGQSNSGGFRQGSIPWNKGTHIYNGGGFKKGFNPWNKGKKFTQISGEKNPNWKGGISSERDKIRSSLKFVYWRKKVFARDNYTCQKCKIKGCYLVAHHIKNFSHYYKLRFIVNNGMTFCNNCHKLFHKIYGKQNNNMEQIKQFIVKYE